MLRSIFSLIQNIIDSDKEYSNKKSRTVIYLVSTPDNNLNMDLEIDGKDRENIKFIDRQTENQEPKNSFKLTTEQGDTVTCEHLTDKKIVPVTKYEDEKLIREYKEAVQRSGERKTFVNDEGIVGDTGAASKESVDKLDDEQTGIRDVWDKLPSKHTKAFAKDKDQIAALMEQIQKMKVGMERLQEIAQQFNCTNQFRQDVEFLTKNVGPALEKSEVEDKNLTQKL